MADFNEAMIVRLRFKNVGESVTSFANSGSAVMMGLLASVGIPSNCVCLSADCKFGDHTLDDALGYLNEGVLAEILESWLISIRNQPSKGCWRKVPPGCRATPNTAGIVSVSRAVSSRA